MNEKSVRQIALIGSTAAGKSSLAIELASKNGAAILSLDSLAIYREIDIASAKPSTEELQAVTHFGIDILFPNERFDVTDFIRLYREARERSLETDQPLIIVGGISFYLKMLLEGISPLPEADASLREEIAGLMRDLSQAYATLEHLAPAYAKRIAPSDRYRIEKALLVTLATGKGPSEYYREHPPQPVIHGELPIFEIGRDREELRQRIRQRTQQMFAMGLIDEVTELERKYSRKPNPMKAIGIREVLDYLDGHYDFESMQEKIVTNTARLAKRQQTFNRSQFDNVIRGNTKKLKKIIESYF